MSASEYEGTFERSHEHRRVRFAFRRRRPEPGVGVDDWRSPPCERVADMGAEAVVVGRVANGRGQWAAQGEVVIDEQAPPWGHDHTEGLGERLGVAELVLEIAEEVNERDIDRFGHELRLAAREEAAERAAGAASGQRPRGVRCRGYHARG